MNGFFHFDLVIARESVHEAQDLVPHSRVYQSIYLWEWIAVLRASLVEVREVYTHPPFTIGLFNHDHVCQPVGVVYFSDEVCLK